MATQPGNPTSRSTRVSDADRAGQVQPWTPQTSVRQTPAALRPPRNTSETRADPYADPHVGMRRVRSSTRFRSTPPRRHA